MRCTLDIDNAPGNATGGAVENAEGVCLKRAAVVRPRGRGRSTQAYCLIAGQALWERGRKASSPGMVDRRS